MLTLKEVHVDIILTLTIADKSLAYVMVDTPRHKL